MQKSSHRRGGVSMNYAFPIMKHKCMKRNNEISPWYVDYPLPVVEDERKGNLKRKTNKTKGNKNCKHCKKMVKHKSYDCKHKLQFYHTGDTKKYIEEYKILQASTAKPRKLPPETDMSCEQNEVENFKVKLTQTNIVLDVSIL